MWKLRRAGRPAWLRSAPVAADRTSIRIEDTPVGTVGLELWAPAGSVGPLPLLLAHDGPELDRLGGLTRYLGAMIARDRLPPMRVALLEPGGERTASYAADPAYAEALVRHVVPALRVQAPSHQPTVLMGASLGALAALHAEWTHPGTFAGLFLESGSFFTRDLDPQESGFEHWDRVTGFVSSIASVRRPPSLLPVAIAFGSSEENAANNRLVADRLTRLGLDVSVAKVRGGHSYTTWRALLDPHLGDLLERAWPMARAGLR